MNTAFRDFIRFVAALPLAKKISIAAVVLMVTAGFGVMFFVVNQENYQVLYNGLSPDDAGAIVTRLKEQNIPYKIGSGGSAVMVPEKSVYETRLALAGEGLPGGGTVGFELFDNPDFRTTNFVQQLNYRRALQGELARTIMNFDEVKKAAVFLAIPRESLFVEDEKQPSASIQLDLNQSLSRVKVESIVRLVANAVEGLDSSRVSVVDTRGRVIFRGDAGEAGEMAGLGGTFLEYKKNIEKEIAENVQSMLEEVVGPGNAIVRVSAEIDTSEVVVSEEEYDPTVVVVRSNKLLEETINEGGEAGAGEVAGDEPVANQRAGILPAGGTAGKSKVSKNATNNYEINKINRRVVRPAGTIQRLSVAAVIDGEYRTITKNDGTTAREYVPRDAESLKMFEALVRNAMGFNEDREDQVSVQSVPFKSGLTMEEMTSMDMEKPGISRLLEQYGKTVFNLILILCAFFLVVRPLIKSVKEIGVQAGDAKNALPPGDDEVKQISEAEEKRNPRQRAAELSTREPERAAAVVRSWIANEAG
jgi:flagellar M-ring protein FliF